jgi:antitoxin component of MazEF toxin-antitoxin module
MFAKLFGQLHHVPDEDLDDAVKVYKNHLLEYPPEEREKLVDATKQMQASLPDGFRQRVENFVHDVDWAVLNRLLPD